MKVDKKLSLAINGGPKVRMKPMPARNAFGKNELLTIIELFDHYKKRNLDFGYQDTYELMYTKAFVDYLEVGGYADAVSSGTAALFVAIAALQLPPSTQVIVSPITDPGTLNAIILNQLVPVLADSNQFSYNMGLEQFEKRVTDKTKAVLVVHAAGSTAPIDMITKSAKEKGLYVIEDCSQAHGARINGKKIGTFGDISAFSTMYRKAHATGGCGGVVFTKKQELHNLLRAYADRGKPFWKKNFNEKDPSMFLFPALNFHIDELSCAIGIKSLEKLDMTIKKRIDFLKVLSEMVTEKSETCRPYGISDCDSPFFYPIFVDQTKISCTKLEFAKAIRFEGIDLNPHYMYIVSEWPWIQPYLSDSFDCPNARYCRDNSFNILFNENFSDCDAGDIVAAIMKVEQAYLL